MKIDLKKFQELVDQKYISVQKHETADLLIWNYSHKAQFDRFWTPETMMARGLITDLEGNIKARPFKKFFNLSEHTGEDTKLPALPIEEFDVYDKLDGSLGIIYFVDGKPAVATRGSFSSEQSQKATQILYEKYAHKFNFFLEDGWTYLFEIIYPQNKIVVDYQGLEDIILLAIIDNRTGNEFTHDGLLATGFNVVKKYDGLTDLSKLTDLAEDNKEGFVVRFKSGVRVKVKFEEYVRLHRLVTGINAKRIWEHLMNNESLQELLERVPDEFFQWVKDTQEKLQKDHDAVLEYAKTEFEKLAKFETRREKAIYINENCKYQKAIFCLLSGKDPSPVIWRMVKPVAEKPFKEDIDA